ncbi:hypothetical protein L596_014377 [Steinernema carpocapsae]|uniref:Uncharacterized protein n=1 Tax=Steinernema carpocapsae TaxID=34508 RepID=A0A4U5NBR8_STECR|nr:hypothetical protein L596_014377 [Steinernema carpocapsae]
MDRAAEGQQRPPIAPLKQGAMHRVIPNIGEKPLISTIASGRIVKRPADGIPATRRLVRVTNRTPLMALPQNSEIFRDGKFQGKKVFMVKANNRVLVKNGVKMKPEDPEPADGSRKETEEKPEPVQAKEEHRQELPMTYVEFDSSAQLPPAAPAAEEMAVEAPVQVHERVAEVSMDMTFEKEGNANQCEQAVFAPEEQNPLSFEFQSADQNADGHEIQPSPNLSHSPGAAQEEPVVDEKRELDAIDEVFGNQENLDFEQPFDATNQEDFPQFNNADLYFGEDDQAQFDNPEGGGFFAEESDFGYQQAPSQQQMQQVQQQFVPMQNFAHPVQQQQHPQGIPVPHPQGISVQYPQGIPVQHPQGMLVQHPQAIVVQHPQAIHHPQAVAVHPPYQGYGYPQDVPMQQMQPVYHQTVHHQGYPPQQAFPHPFAPNSPNQPLPQPFHMPPGYAPVPPGAVITHNARTKINRLMVDNRNAIPDPCIWLENKTLAFKIAHGEPLPLESLYAKQGRFPANQIPMPSPQFQASPPPPQQQQMMMSQQNYFQPQQEVMRGNEHFQPQMQPCPQQQMHSPHQQVYQSPPSS